MKKSRFRASKTFLTGKVFEFFALKIRFKNLCIFGAKIQIKLSFLTFSYILVHTFHADEDIGNAKDIFKQKLSHALGCLHIKPSLFHSLVVSKKYDSIEGVLKKYLCSVIQG